MSGHSKWSTIKHQKAQEDKKRGKAFSKVSKAITVAVKEGGGGDPNSNPRLRFAIDQARQVNMPKANVKRAIEKGLGGGGEAVLQTITYEGFGPEKVAVVIECVTDNKNRTAAEIKSFFERNGGGLGSPGSAGYMFQKKGLILVERKKESEEQMLKLIDLGVEDIEEGELALEIYVEPRKLDQIKKKIEKAKMGVKEASLVLRPTTLAPIEEKTKREKIINFLQKLDDLEDVQKVYCNADFVTQ